MYKNTPSVNKKKKNKADSTLAILHAYIIAKPQPKAKIQVSSHTQLKNSSNN